MNAMAVDDHDATDVSDAAGLRREVFSDALIDHVLAETRSRGLELIGKDGFLNEMLKAVLVSRDIGISLWAVSSSPCSRTADLPVRGQFISLVVG